jgi:hypothetical protein
LDASGENIGPPGVKLIAAALRTSVTGALTVVNLLGNWFHAKSAKMLAEVAKQKGISLCGIRRDQTTADFSEEFLKLPDAILLASDLSQAVVTGALSQVLALRPPECLSCYSNPRLCFEWYYSWTSPETSCAASGLSTMATNKATTPQRASLQSLTPWVLMAH